MKTGIPNIERAFEHTVTREIVNNLGAVSLVGQCLATEGELQTAVEIALRRGDLDQVCNLPGSYSTIMRRLVGECIIAADPTHQCPVFWKADPEGIRLATDGRALGGEPNPAFLAASIICCSQVAPSQTALQDVYRVEAGRTAYFRQGHLVATQGPTMIPDSTITLDEAAHNLRHALTEAIERRVGFGKIVTSDFSGGFDSTTLALLAAEITEGGLDAFIQYQPGVMAGDLSFASRVAEESPSVRLHKQRQDNSMLPFSKLLSTPSGDEPSVSATGIASIRALLLLAREHGSQLHLLGEGGDAILSPSLKYLADLVRIGRLDLVRERAQMRGRVGYADPDQFYQEALRDARRTLADDLVELARLLQNPVNLRSFKDPSRFTWLNIPEGCITFLTAPMRRLLSEQAEQQAATGSSIPAAEALSTYTALAGARNCGTGLRHLRAIAQPLGIELHAPYLDKRVIDACLQAPAHVRAVPGKFKYILQAAFKDILPATLLSRTSKSQYNAEMYKGLRTNWSGVVGLIEKDCRLAELGVIEPEAVLHELHRLDMAHTGLFAGIEGIISAEVWLRSLEGEQR